MEKLERNEKQSEYGLYPPTESTGIKVGCSFWLE